MLISRHNSWSAQRRLAIRQPHKIPLIRHSATSTKPTFQLQNYTLRRKEFPKSQWGVATPSSSEQFKQNPQNGLPVSKSWDHKLSTENSLRTGSSLKRATSKFLGQPGLISLGGGLPSSEYIPFNSLAIGVENVPAIGKSTSRASSIPTKSTILNAGKHDLAEDRALFDIATAFNYGSGGGSAQLLQWVTEHTEMLHRPPYQDWACTMTVGSTSALDVCLRLFTNPGDIILSEEYSFATAIETAAPMGVTVMGVAMDEQGILPSAIDDMMSNWSPEDHNGSKKPSILYTVPSGQNPTGATQTLTRRREIYKVAQKHDMYIFEDEPYYFLQMPPYTKSKDASASSPAPAPPSSHDEFIASLIPSLLSMDTDGRVLRMDSFSKVLAPGSRLGWITASKQIIDAYQNHAELATQGPSGISQLVLYKLIEEHWGHGGYLDWLVHIRTEYTKRRDALLDACERWLPGELVRWEPPAAGMFLRLHINWKLHPGYIKDNKSLIEIEDDIFQKCIKHGVLAMPGSWFLATPYDKTKQPETMFFRVTFAAASADGMDAAIERFARAVRESFGGGL